MGAQPLRIALLGCGVVGSEVVRLLTSQADDLAARIGAPLELVAIGVRDVSAERRVPCRASCSPTTSLAWSPVPTSTSWSS